MEMVKGGSLIDLMDESGPQPASIAGPIMLGALAGLQASHDRGVIHRDIKPHNMLLTLDGVVKITDFGIANMQEDERSFTKTGAVMGTLAYMPPEQRQSAKGLGPTADVFAAGASLYALLTGQEPFDLYNESLQEKLFEGLPKSISDVVIKACSYDPAHRYQSASAMALELQRALREMGIAIAPDNRVSIASNTEGTMFFDPEERVESDPSSDRAPRVDNTTIHPNETFFPSDSVVKEVSTSPRTIPLPTKLKWASYVVRLGLVLLVGWMFYSVNESPEPVPEVTEPSIQNTATEIEEAIDEPDTNPVRPDPEADVASKAPPPEAENPPPVVEAPPVVTTPPEPAPSPPPPEPNPIVVPEPVAQVPIAAGPTLLGVFSKPRGTYSIDGQYKGTMNFKHIEVTPGDHTILVETTGEDGSIRRKELPVSLTAGEKKSVCWDFNTDAVCR